LHCTHAFESSLRIVHIHHPHPEARFECRALSLNPKLIIMESCLPRLWRAYLTGTLCCLPGVTLSCQTYLKRLGLHSWGKPCRFCGNYYNLCMHLANYSMCLQSTLLKVDWVYIPFPSLWFQNMSIPGPAGIEQRYANCTTLHVWSQAWPKTLTDRVTCKATKPAVRKRVCWGIRRGDVPE
jgi:hypothetical protein